MIFQCLRNIVWRTKFWKRGYISIDLGVTGFFEALNRNKVNYVVLRWGERLPSLDPGEDIDLLVDAQSARDVRRLLNGTRRRGIPVDLYSPTGAEGTEHRGVPYYPPKMTSL